MYGYFTVHRISKLAPDHVAPPAVQHFDTSDVTLILVFPGTSRLCAAAIETPPPSRGVSHVI